MDKNKLRDWREKREQENPGGRDFPDVTVTGMKVGVKRRFKIIPWEDAETGLCFHTLNINYVRVNSEKKTYPFRAEKDNVIDRTVKKLYKSKKRELNKHGYNLSGKETMLFHVMDLEDYQLKVLAIDGDGGTALVNEIVECEVDLLDVNNKWVVEITKELSQYKNKEGQVRNKRKYDIQTVEDENCILTPKVKEGLSSLVDLSEIYSTPSDEFATKAIKSYLVENNISVSDLSNGNGSALEEAEAPKVETKPEPEQKKEVAEEPVKETKQVEEKVETPPPTQKSANSDDFDDMDAFLREGVD